MLKKNYFLRWKWHNFAMTFLLLAFYLLLWFTNTFMNPKSAYGLTGIYFFDTIIYGLGGLFYILLSPLRWLGIPDKWYLYGSLYTIAVLGGGLRFLKHHSNERYQIIRTSTIMIVQSIFAFAIPLLMKMASNIDYYFSYFWPLKIEYFYPSTIFKHPMLTVFYSFLGSAILFPVLAYFYGKRFYCSWICGCGGLANTAGDVYRHYSSKTLKAWKWERVSIYSVLCLSVITTLLVFITSFSGGLTSLKSVAAFFVKWYALIVSFTLAGMLGVGLYPLYGTRVWCRFFCPMAGLLGLFQKMGRFQISVQKDTCISCGNCSKYCEMGIDVRSYAQRNLPVKRAACVGCGMCAHVCPRGVLKLENIKPGKIRKNIENRSHYPGS